MKTEGALVLGGDYRALGIVRSLGRRGIPVWVVAGEDRVAGFSRYATRRLDLRNIPPASQADWLMALGERYGLDGWTVFPSAEETAWLVASNHTMLSKIYRLTTSPLEAYAPAVDKARMYRVAAELGLDVPRTWSPASLAELVELDLPYPVALKPTLRVAHNAFTDDKAWRVECRDSLVEQYERARTFVPAAEIMVQDIIPGAGESQLAFGSVCDEGNVVAWVTARRTRQYPVEFGRASTFVETIHDREIVEASTRLLAGLGLSGLVEVEFKRDSRDGKPKLLDVNARAWGWHSIGAHAGVDFSYLAWRVAHGELVEPTQGDAGVRWVRMATDLPATVREIAAGRAKLGPYLGSLRKPVAGAVAARDDRMPALVDMPLLASRVLMRRRRGRSLRSLTHQPQWTSNGSRGPAEPNNGDENHG